jgi:hypothetical protein
MKALLSLTIHLLWVGCVSGLLFLTHCDKAPSSNVHDRTLETFGGGRHMRMVWAQPSESGKSDPFSSSKKLFLMGIDTRDGKSERQILKRAANYSRPLLSVTGETILFTEKQITRDDGAKRFDPVIYRTDWEGRPPKRLASGYACEIWKDPKTGIEWVYAVQDLQPTSAASLNGTKLVRFPLDAPERLELVVEKIPLCPDNMQLSRNGRMMSVQSPWPKAGVLKLGKKGEAKFVRLGSGCWTSMASDDSGLLSICQDNHRDALMVRGDSEETWSLDLGNSGFVKGGEVYHPRWSNHARYIILTGPYKVPRSAPRGSAISQGAAEAQVLIGRLSGDARRIDEWCTASHGQGGTVFPDLWIEGGDDSQLEDLVKDSREAGKVGPKVAFRESSDIP